MSKTFSKILTKIFDVSFSSTFFVLSRFRVFLSDGSSKTLQKTFCKKIVSKSFYKKFDQKSKTDFFSNFFIAAVAVTVRDSGGSWKRRKKHDDKIIFLYNSNIKLNTFKINPVNFIYINFIQWRQWANPCSLILNIEGARDHSFKIFCRHGRLLYRSDFSAKWKMWAIFFKKHKGRENLKLGKWP